MKAKAILVFWLLLILLVTLWLLSRAFIILRLLPILVFLAFAASVLIFIWAIVKGWGKP